MFEKKPILECWTTLSALSSITQNIKLGTMVLCNSFRNPAVLAKMAATFDVLSKGRLELGIGAGFHKEEHDAYGLPFLSPNDRILRLKEYVEIIKNMWKETEVNYQGKFYTTKKAVCEPKPLQKPHPPIIIGGSGEKLTLKVVAEYANRYDWGHLPTLALYKNKLRILKKYCEMVGRNFQEIERSCWLGGQIFLTENQKELDEKIMRWKPKNLSLKDFKRKNLVGSSNNCIKRIQQYTKLGVTNFMLFFGDLPDYESLRIFAKSCLKLESVV
jgi:alkanesulfonate monooxygenase SsuD/methylene tetrahydromethanopterin reductase-like flavin-dependent oxidoreductase (luciferase family)